MYSWRANRNRESWEPDVRTVVRIAKPLHRQTEGTFWEAPTQILTCRLPTCHTLNVYYCKKYACLCNFYMKFSNDDCIISHLCSWCIPGILQSFWLKVQRHLTLYFYLNFNYFIQNFDIVAQGLLHYFLMI